MTKKSKKLAYSKGRPCFVISPIGEENTKTRNDADDLLNKVIRPSLKALGFDANRIDTSNLHGNINQALVEALFSAEIVVANLNGLNPNVMYELGLRHACALPVIPLAPKKLKLPFDVNSFNTIFYGDLKQKKHVQTARIALQKQARRIINNEFQPDGRFDTVVRKFRNKFQLEMLYVAKLETLKFFDANLRRIQREMQKDYDQTSRNALSKFEGRIGDEFGALRDRVCVFKDIAEIGKTNVHSGDCLDIISRMMRLQLRGNGLVMLVQAGNSSPAKFKQAIRMIDALLKSVQGMIEHCHNLIKVNYS